MKTVPKPAAWIETSTGAPFFYSSPVWDIGWIAHSLGNQCRYTGHCRRFYSTAEHSLLVAMIMEQMGLGDPFEGLMHDAHESVVGDVNSPLKSMIPDYRKIEDAMAAHLRTRFNLLPVETDGCKFADKVALCLEARAMIVSKGKDWNEFISPEHRSMANKLEDIKVNFWQPSISTGYFLAAFNEMGAPRGFSR